MFIAIVGTQSAGKSAVEDYLVSKGFTSVRLAREEPDIATPARTHGSAVNLSETLERSRSRSPDTSEKQSFLNMYSPVLSAFPHRSNPMVFASPEELLDHVTRNWRKDFVTVDLTSAPLIALFVKRPFFLLVNVDAPLLQRYRRLQGFSITRGIRSSRRRVRVRNRSESFALRSKITPRSAWDQSSYSLDIPNTERLRPRWDTYFMTLAELASQRSNCMKRRVGAILVRDNRVVATGYNGTPRGLGNCHDGEKYRPTSVSCLLIMHLGGCARCNQTSNACNVDCLCLHAEENALLEVGRDRVGTNAILYCNTFVHCHYFAVSFLTPLFRCPCLKCTIKIIQSGVKTVVYNLSYKVYVFILFRRWPFRWICGRDEASAALFQEAGVEIRRHVPPTTS
ncbi:cytidine deaminase-like protein [Boletus reticuloceps]|uniref:dCMP deaminase n=1 Tax=Boletus reticuloceps TaxID=495285 RepID=A0A8I3AFX7_9AGAM|nr:cytidine deaminase-like protein [Boletus reticuloceps]